MTDFVGPILMGVVGIAVVTIGAVVGRVILRAGAHETRTAAAEAAAARACAIADRAAADAAEARAFASKRADVVYGQMQQRDKKARSRAREVVEDEPVEPVEPKTTLQIQASELEQWGRQQEAANGRGGLVQ